MRALLKKWRRIIIYGMNSVIATVIDVAVVWILAKLHMGIVAANTIGVAVGFVVGYLLDSHYVFPTARGRLGFGIYLGTSLGGLALGDLLIWWGTVKLFAGMSENMNFLFSKGMSIVVPFFVMYLLRKLLYSLCERRGMAV